MPGVHVFDQHTAAYEEWFKEHALVYESEVRAVGEMLPTSGQGVEIGVGSGRFAEPLGITMGVEPSHKMAEIARQRGIQVIDGKAEALPLDDEQFDFALMVTTVCFVDDLAASFRETYRILKPGGHFIIGFVDSDSPIGKLYQQHKHENAFYREATFVSVNQVARCLLQSGFHSLCYAQTLFSMLDQVHTIEPVKEGYGEGSFVVVRATKDG